ncbi:hypothetical protein ABZU05_05950 [Sneathia vaginalis]|uniref:coiled-coil domain-containing protein n=1 Tax=Sneathia vaginalis TaxID=187101 RepID=UPI0035C7457E
MKKTILLASLVASMTALAVESPKGFVEGTAKGGVTFKQNVSNETKISGDVEELSVKGEVKVNRLTVGAVLANKDLKGISKENPITTEKYTDNLLDHSSVYAKYELPEFSGIKSYVKGTLNPKAPTEDGKHNFKKGNVELEGQLAHSFNNDVEVSLTSKTKFPFEKKDGEYGKGVESEHVLKLGAKKLNKFEDLEASLKLNHTYAKEEAFKFVDLSAKGTYAGLKDTKLTSKANFRYQVNGTSDVKDLLTDGQIKLNKDAYAHSYELDGKYTGVKDLELTAGAFVQHVHFDESEYVIEDTLYAKKLMNSTPDFFVKHKEEYEKALETIKNVTETDKTAYENALKEYDQLVEAKRKYLKDNASYFKSEYTKALNGENSDKIKAAYEAQKKINEINEDIYNLIAEKNELEQLLSKKYANKDKIESKIKEIQDKIDANNKLIGENSELRKAVLSDVYGGKGILYANAEYPREDFSRIEEKNKGDIKNILVGEKFKKENNGYVLNNNGDIKADDVFGKINSEYGKALKVVKKYKKASTQKEIYTSFINKYGLEKQDLVNFGFKLGAKYTGVKNLTLTADGVFGGRHHSGFDQLLKYPSYTTGYVKLHAGAKYDYKLLSDKLVVSPEGNVTATFADIYAGLCNPSLVLAPKVSVSYKPVDALKVSGSVEVPVKFELNDFREFVYKNTSIKGSLNMRYEWK